MRFPRSLISVATAALLALAISVAGCGGSGDAGTASGSRNAAAPTAASVLPTKAFITTGKTGNSSGSKLVRCDLPKGPCTDLRLFDGNQWRAGGAQYATGRVFLSWGPGGADSKSEVWSCSATTANDCTKLLPYDSGIVAEPVIGSDGQLLVSADKDGRSGLWSCDPVTTRSMANCRQVEGVPALTHFAIAPGNRVVGIAADSKKFFGDTLVACGLAGGRCSTVRTFEGGVTTMYYAPRFGRVYVPQNGPRDWKGDITNFQMWSCDVEASGGCGRLNTFGTFISTFTSDTDSVYAATEKSIQACDPVKPDHCRRVNPEDNTDAIEPYGSSLLVGTSYGRTFTIDGGFYLRPINGSAGSTIWGGDGSNTGGVTSIATNTADVAAELQATLVRVRLKGSGVTATGRITLSPRPGSGDPECVLPPPELPVTCRSQYPKGSQVTVTAVPGPSSELNTWQGAAATCNEPDGPGSRPSTTCTITLAGNTQMTAGFRPATPMLTTTVSGAPVEGVDLVPSGRVTFSPAPRSGKADCAIAEDGGPATCRNTFDQGDTVTLTADPGEQSELSAWKGAAADCNRPAGPAATCTVTLRDDAEAGAVYAPALTTLTSTFERRPRPGSPAVPAGAIRIGPGPGILKGDGECKLEGTGAVPTCTTVFARGTTAILRVVQEPGSALDSWSGAAESCNAPDGPKYLCKITLTGRTAQVTAHLKPAPPAANLQTNLVRILSPRHDAPKASGEITFSEPPLQGVEKCVLRENVSAVTCNSLFPKRGDVTLTAVPDGRSVLNTWLGAAEKCNEPGGPGTPPSTTCTITMSGDQSVTAGFRLKDEPTSTVRVTVTGSPDGRVTSRPAGISCSQAASSGCTATFSDGLKLELRADPTGGQTSSFQKWGGACSGTEPTCNLTVSADAEVVAAFAEQPAPPAPPDPTPPAPTPPAPQPEPIPTPPGPAPAPNAPLAITGLSVTRQAFTPTQGTQVRYRLTQPAAVTMTFTYGTGKARGTRYTYRIKAGKPGARAGNNRVRIRGVVKGQSVRTGRWVMKVSAAKGTQRAQAKARTLRVRR